MNETMQNKNRYCGVMLSKQPDDSISVYDWTKQHQTTSTASNPTTPDWARSSKYNLDMGKMEMSGPTKAELHNKKIACFGTTTGAEGHRKMLLEVARRTGHLVGSKPHPHLGNMSSPHHKDHPSV